MCRCQSRVPEAPAPRRLAPTAAAEPAAEAQSRDRIGTSRDPVGPICAGGHRVAISSADLAAAQGGDRGCAQRQHRAGRATCKRRISDPVARKLVEWAILRSDDNEARLRPLHGLHLRQSELAGHRSAAPTRRGDALVGPARSRRPCAPTSARTEPTTAKGKFALARALLLQGDRAGAQSLVREAWRNDNFSSELEGQALDVFRDLITTADHKARMDMRLYAEDIDGGLRAANRAGGNAPVIAKARIAVIKKAANAKALLDAVPAGAQRDIGYIFSRVQLLRRADKARRGRRADPVGPARSGQAVDADRVVGRAAAGLPQAARPRRRQDRLSRRARCRRPEQGQLSRRAPVHRRLDCAALPRRSRRPRSAISPRSARAPAIRSRSHAPAIGKAARRRRSASKDEARAHYEAAARYSTAYYGQIARARLGPQGYCRAAAADSAPPDRRTDRSRARDRDPLRHRASAT